MTYYESAEGITITRARALQEVRAHHLPTGDFLAEVGDRPTYPATDVLDWLGY